jgi:ArsR family transcriptional regulator
LKTKIKFAFAAESQMTNTCTDMQMMYKFIPMHRVNIALHEIFQALSDPYRIRIIRLMLNSKSELCLCELSEALEEPEYKLSRHVKLLRSSGIIASVRDGKWIYHSLVENEKFLKLLHKAVSAFPDADGEATKDLLKFEKRLAKRESGRCRQPSAVSDDVQRVRK